MTSFVLLESSRVLCPAFLHSFCLLLGKKRRTSPYKKSCTWNMHSFSSQQIFSWRKIPGRIKSADFFGQHAKNCKTLPNYQMQKKKSNVLMYTFSALQTLLSCHMVHMTYNLTSVKYKICSVIVSRLAMIHAAVITSGAYLDFGADPVAKGRPCSALIATTVPSKAFRFAHWSNIWKRHFSQVLHLDFWCQCFRNYQMSK